MQTLKCSNEEGEEEEEEVPAIVCRHIAAMGNIISQVVDAFCATDWKEDDTRRG